jgi:hypothetical protein
MIIGGITEIIFGVKAERRGLEGIAKPLTAVESVVRGAGQRARSSFDTTARASREAASAVKDAPGHGSQLDAPGRPA